MIYKWKIVDGIEKSIDILKKLEFADEVDFNTFRLKKVCEYNTVKELFEKYEYIEFEYPYDSLSFIYQCSYDDRDKIFEPIFKRVINNISSNFEKVDRNDRKDNKYRASLYFSH